MADERLRVVVGQAPGTWFTVDGELLIGRAASDVDGRLGDDPELSRSHARMARGAGGVLTIEDLGSSNGTFVNGERVEGVRVLRLGDVVRVGTTELAVTDERGLVPEATRTDVPAPAPVAVPEGLIVGDGVAMAAPVPSSGGRLLLAGTVGALVALSLGIYGNVHDPASDLSITLGFADTITMKVWLATLAVLFARRPARLGAVDVREAPARRRARRGWARCTGSRAGSRSCSPCRSPTSASTS